jgi:hypothetical protein
MRELTRCSSCWIGWTSKRFLALSSPFASGTYWMPCSFFLCRTLSGSVSCWYQQRNDDFDSGFLWYVVLKCLWTYVSDFIWINNFMHGAFSSGFVATWFDDPRGYTYEYNSAENNGYYHPPGNHWNFEGFCRGICNVSFHEAIIRNKCLKSV